MPKIESDNVEISLRPVDLDTCLEEVASTCRNLVSQNGNEFILEKSADLGVIDTDQTRLRQILINLLGNAGKFTKNGRVSLLANRVSSIDRRSDRHGGCGHRNRHIPRGRSAACSPISIKPAPKHRRHTEELAWASR